MVDLKDPGTRDRLVLCGQAAIEALGLGESNDAPADVREAIVRLRASRTETITRLRGFRERFDKLMSEIEQAERPDPLDLIAEFQRGAPDAFADLDEALARMGRVPAEVKGGGDG